MASYRIPLNMYHKFRTLSLDVVLGALSGAVMSEKVFNVQMETAWWFVLAFAVWIIYTADHLIDANKLGNHASSERRLFYFRYFKLMLIIVGLLIIITLLISFLFLDSKIIYFGICLGVFITIYLIIIQIKGSEKLWWLQKELIVAMVYTAGIWSSSILHSLQTIGLHEIVLCITFFIIVWADILIIAQFEIENDKQDGFTSLPIIIGKKKNVWLIKSLQFFVGFALLFLLFKDTNKNIIYGSIILLSMSVILFILLKYESFFAKKERYRVVAESVFFLPAFMMFV